ncbi:hypothetical protein NQ315_015881 [Exocentrus adspersus]|uniref:CHK kinase-like domain-containing protein n=1 Tax=Exocentrus adspersus TaxID=1586481 RepID=A0AAV8W3M9_9CUCU|nr:hypothetical protein NQ315_015881 [Exocentrus adspersus]
MERKEILSKDQCERVLERYTGTRKFDLKSYSINPFQSQLDGFLADQHFLKIHYQIGDKEQIVQFFLKILSDSNKVMYEISRNIYAFEKESFYYETVVPLLKSKNLDVGYVARSYFSEPYVVVLEDLSLRNFRMTPKNKPVDLEHCKKCMETLARFHVAPILYELEKSKELGTSYTFLDEYSDVLEDKVFTKEENGATRYVKSAVQGLFMLIDLIPENGSSKSEFKNYLQAALEEIMSSHEDSMQFRSTLLHGDLWSNNFLYRYDEGNIIDCILIDFQTLNYGPPAMDALHFILINTRKRFRDKHQEELLKHYYEVFTSLLKQHGFEASEVLTETEFHKSCEAYALPAKVFAMVDRSITFTMDDYYMETAKSEEEFSRFLFEERGRYMVKDFEENEAFRELLTEDIVELRDMLFAK